MTLTNVTTKRWTREQYYRMADMGWFEGRRVELIDGAVVEMSPQNRRHANAIVLVQTALARIFPIESMRIQLPLALSQRYEPEPDVAVVRGGPRDYTDHPDTALLIVEISESTIEYDRSFKASTYARFRIAEYWVLDLNRRELVVHREPAADEASPAGYRYTSVTVCGASESVAPLAKPGVAIAVADLLP